MFWFLQIASLRWGGNNWNHKHPLWTEYISKTLNRSFTDEERKNLVLGWENELLKYLVPLHANAAGTNFTSGAALDDYQVQFTVWVRMKCICLFGCRSFMHMFFH